MIKNYMKKSPGKPGFIWSVDGAHLAMKNVALWKSANPLAGQDASEKTQHWLINRSPVAVKDDKNVRINICAKSTEIIERVMSLFPRGARGVQKLLVFSSGENCGWVSRMALKLGFDLICTEPSDTFYYYLSQSLSRTVPQSFASHESKNRAEAAAQKKEKQQKEAVNYDEALTLDYLSKVKGHGLKEKIRTALIKEADEVEGVHVSPSKIPLIKGRSTSKYIPQPAFALSSGTSVESPGAGSSQSSSSSAQSSPTGAPGSSESSSSSMSSSQSADVAPCPVCIQGVWHDCPVYRSTPAFQKVME